VGFSLLRLGPVLGKEGLKEFESGNDRLGLLLAPALVGMVGDDPGPVRPLNVSLGQLRTRCHAQDFASQLRIRPRPGEYASPFTRNRSRLPAWRHGLRCGFRLGCWGWRGFRLPCNVSRFQVHPVESGPSVAVASHIDLSRGAIGPGKVGQGLPHIPRSRWKTGPAAKPRRPSARSSPLRLRHCK